MIKDKYQPQYMRIYQSVRNDIIDGRLAPGKKLPSIRSFSKEWSVSNITIVKAFDLLKAEELVTTSERSGFYVAERMQREVSAKKVGFLSPIPVEDLHNRPHMHRTCSHLQQGLRADGHFLSTHLARWYKDGGVHEYLSPQDIADYGLDAVILIYMYNFHYFSRLTELGIPILALDVDASHLGIDSVFFDNTAASMSLCNILIKAGRSNILFVGGPQPHVLGQQKKVYYDPASAQREDGCRLAAQAADRNITIHTAYSIENRSGSEWLDAAHAYLDAHPEVDALVTETPLRLNDKFSHLKQVTFGSSHAIDLDYVVACASCNYSELAEGGMSVLRRRFKEPYAPTMRFTVPPNVHTL